MNDPTVCQKTESAGSTHSSPDWSIQRSDDLYGIAGWGCGYFSINADGELSVSLPGPQKRLPATSLRDILTEAQTLYPESPLGGPVLLRFPQILRHRLNRLYRSFSEAIENAKFSGIYRGVSPIKVNQEMRAVQNLLHAGEPFHHGLEVGSKAELAIAMSQLKDRRAYLVCNGRKDREYLELALLATGLGLRVVLVIESPLEAAQIAELCNPRNQRPLIGVRVRLRSQVGGNWSESSGDESEFGLNVAQLFDALQFLKNGRLLGNLVMLHYHQASQIPDLETVRTSVREAARLYGELLHSGAENLSILNIGGGLAVDYGAGEGTGDYGMDEYCQAAISEIVAMGQISGVTPRVVMSESGRAVMAPYEMLAIPILEAASVLPKPESLTTLEEEPHTLEMQDLLKNVSFQNLTRFVNRGRWLVDDARSEFLKNRLSLRQLGQMEKMFGALMEQAAGLAEEGGHRAKEGAELRFRECYFGSFSLFQSLPDSWGIDQIFPIAPLQRLHQKPVCRGVIKDLTCDSDGVIRKFGLRGAASGFLPLHRIHAGESYHVGAFLLGAYQNSLGDFHNLFGRPPALEVTQQDSDVRIELTRLGDTLHDVLEMVEYPVERVVEDLGELVRRFHAENPHAFEDPSAVEAIFARALRGSTYHIP